MFSILVAAGVVFIRPIRRRFKGYKPCFDVRSCTKDLFNGVALVPLLLLIAAVFSKEIMQEALQTNKVFMAIGGCVGVIFVLGELLKPDPTLETPSQMGGPSR